MSKDVKIRWGWLKGMYIYTIVGAGGLGLAVLFMPHIIEKVTGFPGQDPIVFGIFGSVYAAFGLLSLLGLRSPLKFAPVLLLQLCYKSIWLIGVFLPLLMSGRFPSYGVVFVIIFATYIIGDLIAIPFSSIFAKESDQ